jgi:hypothetical protein
LIETGEERVLSPSASHTQKQQNRKDAVASLTHTHQVAAQTSRSIIVRLPRLSPSHVSQRSPTLLLVTSLCSHCLSNKRSLMIEMAGRQRTSPSSSSSIQSPCDRMRKSESNQINNNSVRGTRLSASLRICFRVRFPPLCFSLDASLRVSFLSHSTCSRWRRCVSSGPRPSRIWAVLCLAARWSIDHSYFGRFKC